MKAGGTDRLTAGKDLQQVLHSDPADAVQTIKTEFMQNTGSQTLVYSGAVQMTTPTTTAAAANNPNDGKIQLFFKTLTNRTRVLRANPSATILELKQQFFDVEGVPVDAQRLIYGGKELEDERTLTDYNIQRESTIFPVLRLRGGGVGSKSKGKVSKQNSKKSAKKSAKWSRSNTRGETIRDREEGQEYARVLEPLGNCRFLLLCADGAERHASLAGSLRRRVKIYKDDHVLVSLRSFGLGCVEILDGSSGCQADIIHKYGDKDAELPQGVESILTEEEMEAREELKFAQELDP